jgi:hypothetical protein
MSDLSSKKAAQTIKLAGADSVTGDESNFAAVDPAGNQQAIVNNTTANPVPSSNTSANGFLAAINPFNRLQVNLEPTDLLSDKFDSALDTAVRWTSLIVGTATDPTTSGNLVMSGGTTAGNAVVVASQPTFTQKANVQISFGITLKIESTPLITGAHRFWGLGTPGSNTVASPLTDAIGFEIDSTGALNACVYQSGTRIFSQPLTSSSDGLTHRYNFIWRTDKVAFFLDSGDVPSATASGKIPSTQILPARLHVLVNTAVVSPTITVTAIGIGDTGRNSTAISDGTYGFRKATVSANGGVAVTHVDGYKASYSAAITGLIAAATGATDLFTITGSSTKTIRITRIGISGTQANQNIINVALLKRSTANSGGVSSSPALVSHDSQNPAATATVQGYTTNATLGTLIGSLRSDKLFVPATTPSGSAGIGSVAVLIMEFGNRTSQSLVLRGTNEVVALNLNGTVTAGSSFDVYIEWTEE